MPAPRRLRARFALLLALLLGLPAFADDDAPIAAPGTPEFRARVGAWLEDLRSERFEVRERARAALEQWGAEAPDLLDALKDDPDAEVRRTVRGILERRGRAPVTTPVPAGDLASVGLVTLEARGRPLGEVLDELGRAHAARIVAPEEFRSRPVDVSLDAVPLFEAVERVAALAGLAARDPFGEGGGLVLEPASQDAEAVPCAWVGPVRVRVTRVTSTRTLGERGMRKYVLALELHWSPEVQLVTYRTPRVKVARDPDGVEFAGPKGSEAQAVYGVGGARRSAEVTVPIDPASPDAKERLATLELGLTLRLRHDRREVRFPDLSALPASRREDGSPGEPGTPGVVTLHALTQPPSPPGSWVAEISATLTRSVAEQSAQAYLEAGDGAVHALWIAGGRSTTSADGLLRLTGRAYNVGSGPPRSLRFAWHLREEEGEVPVRFTDVPLR
jgi:hypothetical protein